MTDVDVTWYNRVVNQYYYQPATGCLCRKTRVIYLVLARTVASLSRRAPLPARAHARHANIGSSSRLQCGLVAAVVPSTADPRAPYSSASGLQSLLLGDAVVEGTAVLLDAALLRVVALLALLLSALGPYRPDLLPAAPVDVEDGASLGAAPPLVGKAAADIGVT